MSHALDFSLGKAAIAYKAKNGKPWHGYGDHILDTDTPEQIAAKAGLDYTVCKSPVVYSVPNLRFNPDKPESPDNPRMFDRNYENRAVIYRNDTNAPLSVMSQNSYTPAQPIELLQSLHELTKGAGYEIDVAGALKGGAVVWALAKRIGEQGEIAGDVILPYVLLLTSYDGSYARTARLTSVRVVCQNTVSYSSFVDGKTTVRQRNSSDFDGGKLLEQLGQFDKAFADYMEAMKAMSQVRMTDDSLKRFFAKLYAPEAFKDENQWMTSPIDFDREKVTSNARNNVAALLDVFRDSPGAALPSASGTLFGALNSVTFYHDHAARTKDDKRWESTTIGQGNRTKDQAMRLALDMLAA